jgi:hypothetical protein
MDNIKIGVKVSWKELIITHDDEKLEYARHETNTFSNKYIIMIKCKQFQTRIKNHVQHRHTRYIYISLDFERKEKKCWKNIY